MAKKASKAVRNEREAVKNERDDIEMPIPVVLRNIEEDEERGRPDSTRVLRREQVNLDKIIDGSGSKFYVTGDTVKIGFTELLDLTDKHDTSEILHLEKEEVVVTSKLLAGIARAEVLDEDDEELQYIDAAAVGLFIGGFLFGLLGLFMTEISYVHTAAWVVFLVSLLMLLSYLYQGVRTGFIKRFWKKYLTKMAKR